MNDILLISENAEIIRSFTDMLSPVYPVRAAASEHEGIEVIKENSAAIAAVLIDLDLARSSNYAFSDEIHYGSSFSSVPIIAISGALPSEEDMDCIDHGFFDLISSVSPARLVHQRIRNAIRAKDSLSLTEVEKMLKTLPSCIFMKDAEGRYVFSTQYWRHLNTENDPNWTIRGKTDLDIRKDKDNARKAMEADRHILETGEGAEYVITEQQDGITDYLQLIKRPVYDEDGRIKGIIALINNITDYQMLKQQLEEQLRTDSHMITAMAADYRSIYYANLDKDECLCVRASKKNDKNMWQGRVFPFFDGFTDYAERYVVEADRAAFMEFINPENIRAGLAHEKMISHRYLSTRSGREQYEMLRIAGVRLIEDRDDNIVHAIAAGFS
ncbi:MAG: PAS domain-containing protein, partial [Lachnospiraceae bacterium]|nr:PAS domain-containing protein [Lachnospiraceae bacterium]